MAKRVESVREVVYLVVWPEHMIVKAGITSGRRWASFLARGAVLYRLAMWDFADWRVALAYEGELHAYFLARYPLAFSCKADSAWLLGRLGGHCETYRIDHWRALIDAPPPPSSARLWTCRDQYVAPPLPMEAFA